MLTGRGGRIDIGHDPDTPYWEADRADIPTQRQQAPLSTRTPGRSSSPPVKSSQTTYGWAAPCEHHQETCGCRRSPQQAQLHMRTSGRSYSPPVRSSWTTYGHAAPNEKPKETHGRRRSPPPERIITGAGQARRGLGATRIKTQWFLTFEEGRYQQSPEFGLCLGQEGICRLQEAEAARKFGASFTPRPLTTTGFPFLVSLQDGYQ